MFFFFFRDVTKYTCSSHSRLRLSRYYLRVTFTRSTHAEQVSRERSCGWTTPVRTIVSTQRNSRLESVAADSNSLPTWRRRRRPRDCRRYDARRRSERRHLTARWLTNFAVAVLFKNIVAKKFTLSFLSPSLTATSL